MSVGLEMDRSVIGIDLSPKFCALIRKNMTVMGQGDDQLRAAI